MNDSSRKKEQKRSDDPKNQDEDDLMDIRIPSGMIIVEDDQDGEIRRGSKRQTLSVVPQKPDDSLTVDDRAILDCWNLTVASHDAVGVTTIAPDATDETKVSTSLSPQPSTLADNDYRWQAKDLEGSDSDVLKNWEPKSLHLPPWAVDPFDPAFIIDGAKIDNDETR